MKKLRDYLEKIPSWRKALLFVLIVMALFAVSVNVAGLFTRLLGLRLDEEQTASAAQLTGGVLAAIAAVFLWLELYADRQERIHQNEIEKRQNEINEASFLLRYNQSFIQDEKMTTVESLLEAKAFYGLTKDIIDDKTRQMFVNYLVYLEGMAPLILNDILQLPHVDDLMAYRFFLAVNTPEVQDKELKRFPEYYRGCFKLYKKWSAYRAVKKLEIPLSETALCKWKEFHNYASEGSFGQQLEQDSSLSDKDYANIAALIYETDPHIYPALFTLAAGPEGSGSPETAGKVLPAVFEKGTDAMFRKENLFVYRISGRIAGLILWHRGGLDWDTESLVATAEELGAALNGACVESVRNAYVGDRYGTDAEDGTLYLINICVVEDMRRKGIGREMMEEFIAEHPKDKMELCVLADNTGAVALYEQMGFKKPEDAAPGFSLSESKPSVYVMTR